MKYPKQSRLIRIAWREILAVQVLGRPFEEFYEDVMNVSAKFELRLAHDPPSVYILKKRLYEYVINIATGRKVPFKRIEKDLQAWIDIGFCDPAK